MSLLNSYQQVISDPYSGTGDATTANRKRAAAIEDKSTESGVMSAFNKVVSQPAPEAAPASSRQQAIPADTNPRQIVGSDDKTEQPSGGILDMMGRAYMAQSDTQLAAARTTAMLAEDVVDAAKATPKAFKSAAIQFWESSDPESIDWKNQTVQEARRRARDNASDPDLQDEYALGIKRSTIRNLPDNLAFSVLSMGAGLVAGSAAFFGTAATVAAAPAAPAAGYAAGAAASGLAAYRMDTNGFLRDIRDSLDEASVKTRGKPMTDSEFVAVAKQYESLVRAHGLWEALPEALGNVIGFGAGKVLFKEAAPGLKGIMQKAAAAGGTVGGELGTETVTQVGQTNAEVDAGLSNQPKRSFTSVDDIKQSAKEVLPDVLLLTGVVAGGSHTAGKIYRSTAYAKNKAIADALSSIIDGASPAPDAAMRFVNRVMDPNRETAIDPAQTSLSPEQRLARKKSQEQSGTGTSTAQSTDTVEQQRTAVDVGVGIPQQPSDEPLTQNMSQPAPPASPTQEQNSSVNNAVNDVLASSEQQLLDSVDAQQSESATAVATPAPAPTLVAALDGMKEDLRLDAAETLIFTEVTDSTRLNRFAKALSTAFGVNVHWVDFGEQLTTASGKQKGAFNGYRNGDTILLNPNNISFIDTTWHELTHVLETRYPDVYRALRETIVPSMDATRRQELITALNQRRRSEVGRDMSPAELDSELVAYTVGEVVQSPETLGQMFDSFSDPGVAKQFRDVLMDVLDKLLSYIRGPQYIKERQSLSKAKNAVVAAFAEFQKREAQKQMGTAPAAQPGAAPVQTTAQTNAQPTQQAGQITPAAPTTPATPAAPAATPGASTAVQQGPAAGSVRINGMPATPAATNLLNRRGAFSRPLTEQQVADKIASGEKVDQQTLLQFPNINTIYVGLTAILRRAPSIKAQFDQQMREFAKENGIKLMAGPIKSINRSFAKVWYDYKGDYNLLKDAVRSTLVATDISQYSDLSRILMERYKGSSIKRNGWDPKSPTHPSGYRDVFFNGISIEGFPVELQMNHPAMLEAKRTAHILYEKQAELERRVKNDKTLSPGDISALNDQINELTAKMFGIYNSVYERVLDSTIFRNSPSEIGTPSEVQVDTPNTRGSGSSQARTPTSRENVTGMPLTSKNEVPAGNESGNATSNAPSSVPNSNVAQQTAAANERPAADTRAAEAPQTAAEPTPAAPAATTRRRRKQAQDAAAEATQEAPAEEPALQPPPAGEPVSPLRNLVSEQDAAGRVGRRLNRRAGVGAPVNQRVVFGVGPEKIVVGKITMQDWVDRVQQLLPTADLQDARRWYRSLEETFRPLFGDDAPKYALAWLMSQKRASPTKGMMDVLRAADMAQGKQEVKKAGLNQQAMIDIFSGRMPEGGIGAKLQDFLDSELGKTTRTIMRDDPRGRQPAAIDVWAERDIGYVDETLLEFLRERHGDEAVAQLSIDKTRSGETQYEYGIDFYNDLVDYLNERGIDGGGWTAREVQAVGWVTMQKVMGIKAEFVRDIIGGNTRRISIGLAPGSNSILSTKMMGREISVETAQKEISYLASLSGIRIRQNVAGVGAYLQWIEGAIQVDALGSPEAVADFMDMVGYAFQQTEVISTRPLASGKNMAIDVMSKDLNTVDKATAFFSKFLETVPKNKNGDPIAPGFQQIVIDGVPGIRLLNFAGNWRQSQVDGILDALNDAAAGSGVTLSDVAKSSVSMDSTKNDWKEQPDGKNYLDSLAQRGRVQEIEQLQRRYAPSRIDVAGDGTISWRRIARLDQPPVRSGSGSGIVLGTRQPGASSFVGVHYGNAQTDSLTGSKYGEGLKGAEAKRLANSEDPRIKKRVYFYIESEGSMPSAERGLGQYVYTQQLDNILAPGEEMSRLFNEANRDSNRFESSVVDAGYDGYAVPSQGMMVVLNHDVPVTYEGTRQEIANNERTPASRAFARDLGKQERYEVGVPFNVYRLAEDTDIEETLYNKNAADAEGVATYISMTEDEEKATYAVGTTIHVYEVTLSAEPGEYRELKKNKTYSAAAVGVKKIYAGHWFSFPENGPFTAKKIGKLDLQEAKEILERRYKTRFFDFVGDADGAVVIREMAQMLEKPVFDDTKTGQFSRSLIDEAANQTNKSPSLFVIGGTPTVLTALGMQAHAFTMEPKNVTKVVNPQFVGKSISENAVQRNRAGFLVPVVRRIPLTVDELHRIPFRIADPVAVINQEKTATRREGYMVITDLVKEGYPVVAVVHPNVIQIDKKGERHMTNELVTVYPANDPYTLQTLNREINSKQLLYLNKGKAAALAAKIGRNLPSISKVTPTLAKNPGTVPVRDLPRYEIGNFSEDIPRGSFARVMPPVADQDGVIRVNGREYPARNADEPFTKEGTKKYMKRAIDTLPSPESLPFAPERFFDVGEDTQLIPVSQIVSSKTDEENQKGGSNAPKRFLAAYDGILQPREPIAIKANPDGTYTVIDGNGTLTAFKQYGWESIPADVYESEQAFEDRAKEKDSAPKYRAFTLLDSDRRMLAQRFPPTHERVMLDHISASEGDTATASSAEIIGVADRDGIQVLVAKVNGKTKRADGVRYHITVSADQDARTRNAGFIIDKGFKPVIPSIKLSLPNGADYSAPMRGFARRMPVAGNRFTLPARTLREKYVENLFENRMSRVEDAQQAVEQQGGTLDIRNAAGTVVGSTDISSAAQRMRGAIRGRLERFKKETEIPLIEDAAKAGVNLEEVAQYLYAMYAPERNAIIQQRNPTQFPTDGGSGMTNAEAMQIVSAFRARPDFANIQRIAERFRRITTMTHNVLLTEGLIEPQVIAQWKADNPNYVPLRGFENINDQTGSSLGGGSPARLDPRNPFVRVAKGRQSRAGQILENILKDYTDAVVLAEKNKVYRLFLQFVRSNPDPALWEVNAPKVARSYYRGGMTPLGYVNGTVRIAYEVNEDPSQTIAVRVAGRPIFIRVQDEGMLEDLQMAGAVGSGDQAKLYFKVWGGTMSMLAKLRTTLAPAFVAIDAFRNTETGGFWNLVKYGPKTAAKAYARAFSAARTAWKAERDPNWTGSNRTITINVTGSPPVAVTVKQLYDMFREDGGKVGFLDIKQIEDIQKDLQNRFRAAMVSGSLDPRTYHIQALDFVSKAEDLMLDVAGSIETSMRFATYIARLEAGATRQEATDAAKNVTVNFDRKGKWTPHLGLLYMFANANVQGARATYNMIFKSGKAGAVLGGSLVALGYAIAQMAAGMAGDDDEPYWDKQLYKQAKMKSLLFFTGDGDTVTIPMPYGSGFFVNLGYAMSDLQRGVPLAKVGAFMRDSFFTHFSPLGPAENIGTFAAPTLLDPLVVSATNKNEMGMPVMPESNWQPGMPDSEKFWASTRGTLFQELARYMNEATGGTQGYSGAVDVSPETLRYWGNVFTGGTGGFVRDAGESIFLTSEIGVDAAVDKNKIPFIKSFYQQNTGKQNQIEFYANADEAVRALNEWKLLYDSPRRKEAGVSDRLREQRKITALGSAVEEYRSALAAYRQEEVKIIERRSNGYLSRAEAEEKLKRIAAKKDKLYTSFNRAFYKADPNTPDGG